MSKLAMYVMEHAVRGACTCGKCIDAPANPKEHQPNGHTVSLTFFKVAALNARKDELLELVRKEYPALLDGQEHNYLEMGAKLGDQGIALMLIGLGHVIGAWQVLCPETIMPFLPDDLKMQMAGSGMVALQAKVGA